MLSAIISLTYMMSTVGNFEPLDRIQLLDTNGGTPFYFVDNTSRDLYSRRVQYLFDRYCSYFNSRESLVLAPTLNYLQLEELIVKLNNKLTKQGSPTILVSPAVQQYIENSRYRISQGKDIGLTLKNNDIRWSDDVKRFEQILTQEISRPLKPQQLQASFYLAIMRRAANFSVPGAGKTAMLLGTFAYLSSAEINKVNRLLVVCPLNAFEAWQTEFVAVFGNKRQLRCLDLHQQKYRQSGAIRMDWDKSNIAIINYEGLVQKVSTLNELIDDQTMIVFDEVHRVKGVQGQRAKAALELGHQARYLYVLTGTPIPNGYQDIWNFLHLLYRNEFNGYFGWSLPELASSNPIEANDINDKLAPFFWRINKKQLNVPPADPDKIISVKPNDAQAKLAELIYKLEGDNVFSLFIRLIQASTNPELLEKKIDLPDLGLTDEDGLDYTFEQALNDDERERAAIAEYRRFGLNAITSQKFNRGIDLVCELVGQGKKVLVWAIFVDTMHKIQAALNKRGLRTCLVYGGTPRDERSNIINDFRNGQTEVMITNPNTLGESVSLHRTVHDAVYFEYNFNLVFMLQSRDRIHRLGLPQGQYTRYYYLMTEGSRSNMGYIDQAIYERLKEKEAIMQKAIDGEILAPEITSSYLDEIKRIFLA